MLNKIYIKFLLLVINFIDVSNKKKIVNFFKKKFDQKSINVIDIGAHKGETIDLFYRNFNINKIFAFEANPEIFIELKKKIENGNYLKKIELFNTGLGDKEEVKNLLIFNDSSSSTYNNINEQSKYYIRKKSFLSLFESKKESIKKKVSTIVKPLSDFIEISEMNNIDILKIDTEGYEMNILKGTGKDQLKKIKYIYFEHHYDLMIKKNYKYKDIKKFLNENNFFKSFKIKMKFRKTFEYIYEKKN